MPIPVQQFPILSFEQANPFQTGMGKQADILGRQLQNQQLQEQLKTLGPLLQEQLKQAGFTSTKMGVEAQYAQPMEAAKLSHEQAQTPYLQAQTVAERALAGKYGAETGKTRAETAMENWKLKNPMMSMPGAAGQIGAMLYLRQHPELDQLMGGGQQGQTGQPGMPGIPQPGIPQNGIPQVQQTPVAGQPSPSVYGQQQTPPPPSGPQGSSAIPMAPTTPTTAGTDLAKAIDEGMKNLTQKASNPNYTPSLTDGYLQDLHKTLTAPENIKNAVDPNTPLGSALHKTYAEMQQNPQIVQAATKQMLSGQEPTAADQPVLEAVNNPAPTDPGTRLSDILRANMTSASNKQAALANYLNVRSQAMPWQQMPATDKHLAVSQAKGLGYTGDEANKLFASGYTLPQLAAAKGFSPDHMPPPDFSPTTATLTYFQRSNVARQEMDTVDPIITKWMAPYSSRFNGYSMKQVIESIKHENTDEAAKYLAAAFVQPELATMRLRASGGQNIGIEAMDRMMQMAMGNIKYSQLTTYPELYKKTMNNVNFIIDKMNNAQRHAISNYIDPETGGGENKLSDISDDTLARIAGQEGGGE